MPVAAYPAQLSIQAVVSVHAMRRAPTCLLALALILCGGVSGAAAQAGKSRASACQKLAARHRDRAPSHRLVTVVRGDDETGRISACLLPRGKVRTLASWDDGLSRDWANVVATAGTHVLVEEGHGDQYGGVSRSLTRVEVQHGRRLELSGYGCQAAYAGPRCPTGSDYDEVAMAPSGAGAYERSHFADATTALWAFGRGGALTKLADGAVDALRVTRTRITWTQAGLAHSAPVPS
jgi:hypothetical protein